ncbi:FecR family protein [Pedobacter sp. AW31-3R]|uniref:FecR family protein n=1 Tax=Pedobacter sp. AW31-3R TaxID=3445781 RepID=UPI003FA0DF38
MKKQCSKAELEDVMSIIEAGTYLEEWDFALTEDAKGILELSDIHWTMTGTGTENLHNRIIAQINGTKQSIPLKRSTWKYTAAAAAAVVALVCGFWFFQYQDKPPENGQSRITYAHDIAPGKSGATLRIGNGKRISLNGSKAGVIIGESKVRYNDGTEAIFSAELNKREWYTAATAGGNTYMLTLPDGTKVWLNAASQIEFPSRFDGENRQVNLEGEAFFQVAKDSAHPFIVIAKNQQIKVLGTHFNVNSYADENETTTTLLEGKVQITAAKANITLVPNQQATVDPAGTARVSDTDTELAIAWKNNKFMFESNDIKSVMRMIQRWYNVDVIYRGPLPDVTFGGKVSRFDNISSVLRVLETTGGVHFKIEGRKIYVSK